MRLDVSNYFDTISIRKLLNNLDQYVMPSIKKRHHFDPFTIQEITQFFQFVSRGQQGIPQSDNDVVSGYIGYLYLIFGELIIDDEIAKYNDLVETYSIIRYVDDIFISVAFEEGISEHRKAAFADRLVAQVAHTLYQKLGLNMNLKTKLFWLNDDDERDELLNEIRQVSPEYHFSGDDDETPENKANAILNQLNQLKGKPVDPLREYSKTLNEEILREVFDDRVDQLFNMDYFRSELQYIFSDFNFDHVKVLPFELLILILKNEDVAIQFRDYLLGLEYLTAVDTNLILRFLCQTEFTDPELIWKLRQNDEMHDIMNVFLDADLYSSNPGYFNLSYEQVLSLLSIPDLLIQTKNRILCERREDYSPALNHLLNEFQSVCFYLDTNHPKQLKQYTSLELVKFLDKCHVPSEVRNAIERLFNRRNSNTVSHPGEEYGSVWGVDSDEYHNYRNQVGQCLKLIVPSSKL
ncbi:MAG: AbiA family abortive infection protein [Anaerolineaceae bacterium]|nr:AbiA family abortive infection protein [Anaerolineaceae bacterium]